MLAHMDEMELGVGEFNNLKTNLQNLEASALLLSGIGSDVRWVHIGVSTNLKVAQQHRNLPMLLVLEGADERNGAVPFSEACQVNSILSKSNIRCAEGTAAC